MSDPRDYKLDLRPADAGAPAGAVPGSPNAARPSVGAQASPPASRPFLSVHFACCGVYQRVYRSADETSYLGRCPRCSLPVRFVVGPGGTGARTFVVR